MNDASTPQSTFSAEAAELVPSTEATTELKATSKYFRWFTLVVLLTVAVDQLSKIAIRRALDMGDQIPLVPGWIHLSHVLNHGAAWGMMTGQRPLLIIIAVGVIAVVVWLAREQVSRGWRPTLGLGLILGGAVGNLIDRILFGAVTDFIDLDTPLSFVRTFPVFNGADSALTVGVILLMWDLAFDRRTPGAEPPVYHQEPR